jgi:small-conductance mechanosensitive channel
MRAAPLFALLIALAAAAQSQEAAAPAAQDWIRPEEVPAQADALLVEIDAASLESSKQAEIEKIERGLAELAPELDALVARTDEALAAAAPLDQVEELAREITAKALPLDQWQKSLKAEALRVPAIAEPLARAETVWSATLARPEIAAADPAVARRIRASLDLLRSASESLRVWRDRVLALEDRLAERRAALTAVLARVQESANAQRTALLVPDRPPLWRSGYFAALRGELPRVPETLAKFVGRNREYLLADVRPLVAQLIFGALLAWLLYRASRVAHERAAAAPELVEVARVLERPISIAVLVTLLVSPWLHPLAPRLFTQMLAIIALVPVVRVITHVSPVRLSRAVLAGLFGLLLLDRVRLGLEDLPAVAQTLFLVELTIGLALAIRVLRRGGLPGRPTWVRRGAAIVAAVVEIALLADIGGWNSLATMLGRAALGSALFAVYAWAVIAGLDALIAWVFRSRRWSSFVASGEYAAQKRARTVVRWITAATWLFLVLGNAGLRGPAARELGRILDAGVSIGALSITLGGVLAFAVTILAAPIAARFVNAALETGVYPRARLPRGMPYALSRMVSYAVYTLAFITALAAAGVQLSQLTILIGGLGVGVGLGLQDFVKNFAAGLTLLFERRVHVGDVVQIPSCQVFGRVLQIGMRAVMVKNWDGAEVIVPNIELIATAVTNWTLSDQIRRIELPVGVAYGTDPAKVVQLLEEVARTHADVIAEPPPQALFLGFGESTLSFSLRAWTDSHYDRTQAIRSELAIAVQRVLQDAGIPIPFPQRDLHLASVSPAAREAIRGKEAK